MVNYPKRLKEREKYYFWIIIQKFFIFIESVGWKIKIIIFAKINKIWIIDWNGLNLDDGDGWIGGKAQAGPRLGGGQGAGPELDEEIVDSVS